MMFDRVLIAAVFATMVAAVCHAASDGNYSPADMGCTNVGNAEGPQPGHNADATPDHCQAWRVGVSTDNNDKVLRVGLFDHEEPDNDGFNGGHNPHHGTTYVGSPGEEVLILHYGTGVQGMGGGDLSDDHNQPELEAEQTEPDNVDKIDTEAPGEAHVWMGADDNLESGEHDGIPEKGCHDPEGCPDMNQDNSDLANGPSDGGEIRVDLTPDQEAAEQNVDPDNPYTNPVPAAYAGIGACVDGICFTAGTSERQVYDGGQDGRVYLEDAKDGTDYKDTDDYCNNNNDEGCVRTVHDQQQDFYSHPGITIYEDPDPQDSSAMTPGPDRNTHVGGGGVVILGETVIDPENPAAMDAQVEADTVSPCCAAVCSRMEGGNCVEHKRCNPDATVNLPAIPERQGIAGCSEVDVQNCTGGAISANPGGCIVVGGTMLVDAMPSDDVAACTAAAVAACCENDACITE
jgi:hypothetical protein